MTLGQLTIFLQIFADLLSQFLLDLLQLDQLGLVLIDYPLVFIQLGDVILSNNQGLLLAGLFSFLRR